MMPTLSRWEFLVLLFLLAGCEAKDLADLDLREGKVFQKGSNRTYTGKVVSYYPDGGAKQYLYQQGTYEMGLKEGHWTTHKWGGDREEADYHLGNLQGRVSLYNSRGSLLKEEEYRNGLLNGISKGWNSEGELIAFRHYQDGHPIPMPAPTEEEEALEDPSWKSLKKSYRDAFSGP